MSGLPDPSRRARFSEDWLVSKVPHCQRMRPRVRTQEAWSTSRCSSIRSRMRTGFIITHWVSCWRTRIYRENREQLRRTRQTWGAPTFVKASNSLNETGTSSVPKGF